MRYIMSIGRETTPSRPVLSTRPVMSENYAPAHNGSMYYTPQYLLLFQQINLAACAARRAQENVTDSDRFGREYDTAKMWARKRVVV